LFDDGDLLIYKFLIPFAIVVKRVLGGPLPTATLCDLGTLGENLDGSFAEVHRDDAGAILIYENDYEALEAVFDFNEWIDRGKLISLKVGLHGDLELKGHEELGVAITGKDSSTTAFAGFVLKPVVDIGSSSVELPAILSLEGLAGSPDPSPKFCKKGRERFLHIEVGANDGLFALRLAGQGYYVLAKVDSIHHAFFNVRT